MTGGVKTTMARNATHDKALGAYIGGAIGDAMGGPVEGFHAAKIKRLCGRITDLLPYAKPHYTRPIGRPAGSTFHAEPGGITDDTLIRGEMTRFFLDTAPPRTARKLADYFNRHVNRDYFWFPKLEPLDRIKRGEVDPEEAGQEAPQGGGAAWWAPIGILNAGNPKRAAEETRSLCRIWKAPFEQDMLACVQAALAEGMRKEATLSSMLEALLAACGPLPRKLMERGIRIGQDATDLDDLISTLYHTALMPENVVKGQDGMVESANVIKDVNAPMPPIHPCLEDTDEKYITNALAEQIPFAAAAFVFSDGKPEAIADAVMLGRDTDSIATTVGSWVGALYGELGLPRKWVEAVCTVNLPELDIRGLAEKLFLLIEPA